MNQHIRTTEREGLILGEIARFVDVTTLSPMFRLMRWTDGIEGN
jgi:hypothetical protein